MMINIIGSIDLLNTSLIHNSDAVGHGHSLDLVMGYINHSGLKHFVQLYQLGTSLLAQLSIKIGQGLIQEEIRGLLY